MGITMSKKDKLAARLAEVEHELEVSRARHAKASDMIGAYKRADADAARVQRRVAAAKAAAENARRVQAENARKLEARQKVLAQFAEGLVSIKGADSVNIEWEPGKPASLQLTVTLDEEQERVVRGFIGETRKIPAPATEPVIKTVYSAGLYYGGRGQGKSAFQQMLEDRLFYSGSPRLVD